MIKRALSCFFTVASCLFIYTGCYYDKASLVYPDNGTGCDTSTVRLSVELNVIMGSSCFSCHGGTASLGSGIQLEDYTVLKEYADNGILLSSITQDGNASAMPKSGPKLSDCDINKFRAWIDTGAPNN